MTVVFLHGFLICVVLLLPLTVHAYFNCNFCRVCSKMAIMPYLSYLSCSQTVKISASGVIFTTLHFLCNLRAYPLSCCYVTHAWKVLSRTNTSHWQLLLPESNIWRRAWHLYEWRPLTGLHSKNRLLAVSASIRQGCKRLRVATSLAYYH